MIQIGKKTLNTYHWQGINNFGEKKQGVLHARNKQQAKLQLNAQALIIRNITKEHKRFADLFSKKINRRDITFFSRQMTTLLTAGIPLTMAIEMAYHGTQHRFLQWLFIALKQDINAGHTLTEALRKHPHCFNALFCQLIHVGEVSGTLALMFDKLATHHEKLMQFKQKIRKTLLYPCVIILLGLFMTEGLLIYVVPQFTTLFAQFGANLPLATRCVIHLSSFLHTYWHLLTLCIITISYGIMFAYRHIKRFERKVEQFSLKAPIIGKLYQETVLARFADTLSLTLTAGLPLVEALRLIAGVTKNSLFHDAILRLSTNIANGQRLQFAMHDSSLFPQLLIQMVHLGEESGQLEPLLARMADYYTMRVDDTMHTLNRLLEPVFMSILGLFVGGLMLAMYLPLLQLGKMI